MESLTVNLESQRRFQLWEYRVSHGSLLIRSPMGPEEQTNVDVLFDGVEYIGCPRMMRGLSVREGRVDDELQAEACVGAVILPERLLVLVSEGVSYYVVASACRVEENQADIFDSPFEGAEMLIMEGPRPVARALVLSVDDEQLLD